MGFELSREAQIFGDRSTATNATGRLTGTIVDLASQGGPYESVLFIADYAATNAGTDSYLSAQFGTASDAFSDVTGEVRISLNTLYLDIQKVPKRFARGVLISTVSGETKALITIPYNPRSEPSTQPAGTTGLRVYSPVSGTATG